MQLPRPNVADTDPICALRTVLWRPVDPAAFRHNRSPADACPQTLAVRGRGTAVRAPGCRPDAPVHQRAATWRPDATALCAVLAPLLEQGLGGAACTNHMLAITLPLGRVHQVSMLHRLQLQSEPHASVLLLLSPPPCTTLHHAAPLGPRRPIPPSLAHSHAALRQAGV